MLSLTFGGSAALEVNRFVTDRSGGGPMVERVPVVVPVADVPRGASITASLVKTRDYPKGILPQGTLPRVEDVLGRTVFVPLVKDEPVLDGKLAPKGARRGMAALVPQGMRAFTIHTPSVASGVGGFILPGNKVDVLLTMEGKRGSITTTLVQNLEILAVDQRIDAPADNRVDPNQLRSVTLLVTPDQAARLGLGQNKGALHLSLRNHEDNQIASAAPARLTKLDDEDSEKSPGAILPPRARKSPAAARAIAIYRGIGSLETHPVGEARVPARALPVESVSRDVEPRVEGFR
jgi:pilus assembly protein CpaB